MFKYLMATVVALTFVACGTTTSGTREAPEPVAELPTKSTIIYAGGDVVINDVIVSGQGTYIQNADGTVTYQTGEGTINADKNNDGGAKTTGVYDPDYNQAQCAAEGFFWCPLENKCLNKPAQGSSCTSNAAMSISIYSDGIM